MKKVLCAMLALSMSLALSGCFLAPAVLSGGESGGETTKTTVKAAPSKMGDTVKGDKWGITLQSAKLYANPSRLMIFELYGISHLDAFA